MGKKQKKREKEYEHLLALFDAQKQNPPTQKKKLSRRTQEPYRMKLCPYCGKRHKISPFISDFRTTQCPDCFCCYHIQPIENNEYVLRKLTDREAQEQAKAWDSFAQELCDGGAGF